MTGSTLFALSAGLAMDATAVSAARGVAANPLRARDVARLALFFGGFQAMMPVVGWLLGEASGPLVAEWAHWVAFALLAAIGGKAIWDARAPAPKGASGAHAFGTSVMLLLALATSVDALAVGFTLPLLGAPLLLSVLTIGLVTAAFCVVGAIAGRYFGHALGRRFELAGGFVLIFLGVKILVEHLG